MAGSAKLGILGAGQLALYLCQTARYLGIRVSVLSESADAPALSMADQAFTGTLDDEVTLEAFLASCEIVTFDKEGIPGATLERLVDAAEQNRVAVNPGAEILLLLKDKGLQRSWLSQHGLPTLPFDILPGSGDSVHALADKYGPTVVQKTRSGGYDGRGVQVLDLNTEPDQLWDTPSILEPCLADRREISVLTVRSASGATQTYPPVGMEFDRELNAVRTVLMPAVLDARPGRAAVELAERVVRQLDGVGVFAAEMFVTANDELLINEISPRVHNAGHLTLDACNVSQFEQHVRAVTGLPLVPINQQSPVGRKMGHINSLAASVSSAVESARQTAAEISCGGEGIAA